MKAPNESSSDTDNVTIVAETFSDIAPSTTLSEDSSGGSKRLICKTPQSPRSRPKRQVDVRSAVAVDLDEPPETHCSKSLRSDASERLRTDRPRLILWLGVCQLLVGVGMVVVGGLVIVHGAALGKTGAGLWSGCFAITTGILGVLAGINDCYGLYERKTSRMGNLFLTLFLALSLISLAAGNLAAVLAGTGLLRDVRRPEPNPGASSAEQREHTEKYWPPILANIGLLCTSATHCLLALVSVYHTAKRVCSCFRPREPFNHNQFDPSYSSFPRPYSIVSVSEKVDKNGGSKPSSEVAYEDARRALSSDLEGKLAGSDVVDAIHPGHGEFSSQEGCDFGSANSKDRLVCNWLGGQPTVPSKVPKMSKKGVKKAKMRQMPPPPMLLYPAGSVVSRGRPVPLVPVPASKLGYATLPLIPAGPMGPPPPHMMYPPVYPPYPVNDMLRIPHKHYVSSSSVHRRDQQLARSLERISRQKKSLSDSGMSQKTKKSKKKQRTISEADVIKTYTGLDRTIAEQFINACNENRHHNHQDKSDSSFNFDSDSNKY